MQELNNQLRNQSILQSAGLSQEQAHEIAFNKDRHVFSIAQTYREQLEFISKSITTMIDFHLKYFMPNQFERLITELQFVDWLIEIEPSTLYKLVGISMDEKGFILEFCGSSLDGGDLPLYVATLSVANQIKLLEAIENIL